MKIVVYFLSLLAALVCVALALEIGLSQWLPDVYRGYLVEVEGGKVKWALGPFEPSNPSKGYNEPVVIEKPENTLRIVSLGASGTEGWLTAKTVFQKYGQKWEPKKLSSYSRAIQFSLNQTAGPSGKSVEVINLGIAAYNITDVIRMLKDSLRLKPDLFLIQIGGNETWTGQRTKWSSYISDDIPYLYTELANEILSEKLAAWPTLDAGGDAFNPLALFNTKPMPIVPEPAGRAAGTDSRLERYREELDRLGEFLRHHDVPVLFLIPPQNLADFQPFGSMAKVETSAEQLQKMNDLLIAALAQPDRGTKEQYEEILAIDDGIAEANFRLGGIYLNEGDVAKAREYFWRANDRDLVLKRLPSAFHDISRAFVEVNGFPYIDLTSFFESKSPSGVVGYNWLDDDVHPNRHAQFVLANEVIKIIQDSALLPTASHAQDVSQFPTFEEYNQWTGFDDESAASVAYLKALHNFLIFGRYRQRMRWDDRFDLFLQPILDDLNTANRLSPSDSSLTMTVVLNVLFGSQGAAADALAQLDCSSSPERSSSVHAGVLRTAYQAFRGIRPKLKSELVQLLVAEGCNP